MRTLRVALAFAAAILVGHAVPRAQQPATADASVEAALKPTTHPRLPPEPSQLWLAPDAAARAATRGAAIADFTQAVKLEVDNNFARALPMLSQPVVKQGTLGHYAQYYLGLAELRVGRAADARRTFQALSAQQPLGYLIEAAALREADADEALGDPAAALQIYDRLAKEKTTTPDEVLMRLGRLAKAAGTERFMPLKGSRWNYV